MIETKEYELMFEYTPLAQAVLDVDLNFVKVNLAFVKLFGIPADRLLAMVEIAARLRIKGFRLALDEYGGGNAGVLEMLKIPFTDIKFDRSIVDGCSETDNRRAVLEAGLAIARTMKISTTAVGVAKRTDWNLLAELGCDAAQGRFIARPMSEVGIGVWVTQWMMNQR